MHRLYFKTTCFDEFDSFEMRYCHPNKHRRHSSRPYENKNSLENGVAPVIIEPIFTIHTHSVRVPVREEVYSMFDDCR